MLSEIVQSYVSPEISQIKNGIQQSSDYWTSGVRYSDQDYLPGNFFKKIQEKHQRLSCYFCYVSAASYFCVTSYFFRAYVNSYLPITAVNIYC